MSRIAALAVVLFAGSVFAADRKIVVPENDKPFKAKQTDIVRIEGTTPSGGTVEAKVDGPAKIENTNTITKKAGDNNVIGALIKEFEIKPSGKGKVTVTITTTGPGRPTDKNTTTYEFNVE